MIVKELTWNITQKFANFGTRDYEHHSQRVNAVFETRQSLSLEGAKNIPSATEGGKSSLPQRHLPIYVIQILLKNPENAGEKLTHSELRRYL